MTAFELGINQARSSFERILLGEEKYCLKLLCSNLKVALGIISRPPFGKI